MGRMIRTPISRDDGASLTQGETAQVLTNRDSTAAGSGTANADVVWGTAMTTTVARTRQSVEANKRRLLDTRHLIRLSRRVLDHPEWRISGASDAAEHSVLDAIVRAMLNAGTLRPLRSRVAWAGHGSGKTCCVCGQPVRGSEVEYEVDQDGR